MLILEPCCLSRHRDGYTDQTDRPAINSLEHARHKDLGLLPASSISSFHFLLHDLRGSVQKPPVSREETLAHYWPWSVGKVRDEHLLSCLVLVFRMTGDTHFLLRFFPDYGLSHHTSSSQLLLQAGIHMVDEA